MKFIEPLKIYLVAMMLLLVLLASDRLMAKEPNYPEASYDHKFHFVASLGIKNGGDSLISVVEQGTNEVIEKLRVGGYVHGDLGVLVPVGSESDFSVQITVGYLYDEVNSSVAVNDNVKLRRTTAEIIPFYNFGRQRIGFGVMGHFNPEAEAKIGTLRETIKFDDAVGGLIQYDIMYDQSISAGIRLDYIEYKALGQKFKAPTIGIHMTFQF